MSKEQRIRALPFIGGVVAGALVAATIRVWAYEVTGWQPSIHPGIGYIFIPILAVPLALVTLLMHAILRKFFAYTDAKHWALAGLAYGLWFLALLGPVMLGVVAIFNPIVFRCVQIARHRVAR